MLIQLINKETCETFLEISANFHYDWRWHNRVSELSPTIQIPILVTDLDIHYFSFYSQEKQTYLMDFLQSQSFNDLSS